MTVKRYAELSGDPYAVPKCQYCNKRAAEILYCLGGDAGYVPFCVRCCKHLALGMLRDVAAIAVGEERAQKEYVAFLEKHNEL